MNSVTLRTVPTSRRQAVQAAAHVAGWLVQVDVVRLVLTAEQAPNAAVRSPQTWRRLRAYREPYRGAAAALAAADVSIVEMQTLRLDDVGSDGTSVTVTRDDVAVRVAVPAGADVFVRAQLLFRSFEGAAGTDTLFREDAKGRPMNDRHLVNALMAAITDLGVAVTSRPVHRRRVDANRWTHRCGVSVQAIA
jgi:hypothetical protein